MASEESSKHFILVHGVCHGAWCWYKLKPLLESAGHKVTAIDMAASGIDSRRIEDLRTFKDYCEPLLNTLASIPKSSGQKVVLVGHSFGGMSIALAADMFPEKVSVLVFVTAFLPDCIHSPSYVIEDLLKKHPTETWDDTKFEPYGNPCDQNQMSIVFGPKHLAHMVYQLCPPEDLALVTALGRRGSFFMPDLAKASNFSEERFGSVPRVYMACKQDFLLPIEYQRWMIENIGGVNEVIEMDGVDHMPMLSNPNDLCRFLIAMTK